MDTLYTGCTIRNSNGYTGEILSYINSTPYCYNSPQESSGKPHLKVSALGASQ